MSFYELAEKAMELERQGKKIIRLNIGDTNLPTDPRIVEAAVKSMQTTKAKYGPALGLPELREMIAKREGCDVKNIAIGPSSKYLIFALMSVLLSQKERVVLPTPTWPAYEMVCRQLSLEAVKVKTTLEDQWNFTGLDLDNAAMVIICNPNNPTSTLYDDTRVSAALEVAQKNNVHAILDEAYRDLSFKEIPKHENAIRVRSFSKEFNMEGWRIGYVVAPEDVVKKLASFMQITTTCVPLFTQKAAIAAIENEKSIKEANLSVWQPRVDKTSEMLAKAGFKFAKPDAGIYFFLTHDKVLDGEEYAMRLLDAGVAVSPGSAFGDHSRFIRICANQDEKILQEAIDIMAQAL